MELGPDHHNYIPSALLSQRIAQYTKDIPALKTYLSSVSKLSEIDSEQAFDKSFKELSKLVEPVVVHVRVGGSSNELRSEIVTKLVQEEGYIELDKEKLQAIEIQRRTELGKEISRSAKHKITAE